MHPFASQALHPVEKDTAGKGSEQGLLKHGDPGQGPLLLGERLEMTSENLAAAPSPSAATESGPLA